ERGTITQRSQREEHGGHREEKNNLTQRRRVHREEEPKTQVKNRTWGTRRHSGEWRSREPKSTEKERGTITQRSQREEHGGHREEKNNLTQRRRVHREEEPKTQVKNRTWGTRR